MAIRPIRVPAATRRLMRTARESRNETAGLAGVADKADGSGFGGVVTGALSRSMSSGY